MRRDGVSVDRLLRFVAKCNSRPPAWRLTAAAGLVLLATGLRIFLTVELANKFIYVSYFPAVSIAAMMTGVAGGVFATILSIVFVHIGADAEYGSADLVRSAGFIAAAAVIVGMAKLLQLGRDRLATSEAARHDVERLRQFIEQTPVALAMFDEHMRYIAISHRWREDYHLGDQPIVGRSHYEIFPDISETWKKIHQRGLAGETVRAEETLLLRANGDGQWLRWEVRPWYREGKTGGIILFSEDITARKQSEERISRSEARFRAMFENSAVGMAQVSPEGRFLHVNQRLCEMLGYSQAEMESLTFQDVTYPDDLAADLVVVGRLHAREIDQFSHEKRYISKDGRVVWGKLSAGAVFDARKKLAYIAAVIEDISERKRAEDVLRKFSRVIEQTASTVVITNAEGIIEYVNPHFSEITGYAVEEVVGNRPNILKSGHTAESTYDELWRTIKSGQVWRGEFNNRRKDGTLYWESAIVSPVRDSGGAITHFVAIQDDISQRKEIESQFAAAHRMEAVGRLAGGIAHDFNNLLAVIAGNLELIRQRSDDGRVQELVRPALDAAYAGAAFNRRLLSIGGKQSSGASALFVNARVRDMYALLVCTLEPQITLQYELADDLWPSLADAGELDNAILNLVINSRDAMPQGGKITILTRNVSLDADAVRTLPNEAHLGDYLCISVIDEGEGMSADVLERATEPFFTTKMVGRGTGLGLSGVRSFAVGAGGFVTIESREGEGTRVELLLPRAPADMQAERPLFKHDELPLGDGECVLVVEDDERVREMTLRRVEALGYVAESARTGSEAMELLKSGLPVDLVLSDIVMPGTMNGFDLARQVRAEMPGTKIVFATGFSGEPLAKNQALLDIPVLHKPYARDHLARVLAETLGKGSQSRETSLAST